MMLTRTMASSIVLFLATAGASAQIASEHTDLSYEETCSVVGMAEEGDGDWANYVCTGYRGYPVIVSYADERESIFYGFPPEGGAGFIWEGFEGFSSAGPTIEWRVERRGEVEIPFATIHRWTVTSMDEPDETVEVLVVEKVGLLPQRQGCAIAYVMATGNEEAEEQARQLADTQARDFQCGDQPTIFSGDLEMPAFSRGGN